MKCNFSETKPKIKPKSISRQSSMNKIHNSEAKTKSMRTFHELGASYVVIEKDKENNGLSSRN